MHLIKATTRSGSGRLPARRAATRCSPCSARSPSGDAAGERRGRRDQRRPAPDPPPGPRAEAGVRGGAGRDRGLHLPPQHRQRLLGPLHERAGAQRREPQHDRESTANRQAGARGAPDGSTLRQSSLLQAGAGPGGSQCDSQQSQRRPMLEVERREHRGRSGVRSTGFIGDPGRYRSSPPLSRRGSSTTSTSRRGRPGTGDLRLAHPRRCSRAPTPQCTNSRGGTRAATIPAPRAQSATRSSSSAGSGSTGRCTSTMRWSSAEPPSSAARADIIEVSSPPRGWAATAATGSTSRAPSRPARRC